jgi:hypothetical protein
MSTLSGPAKDIVRDLFLKGPKLYEHLPRAGRGECVDCQLMNLMGDWAHLSPEGMELALDGMGLASVKTKRAAVSRETKP